jgi:hypothetical protein
VFGVDVCFWLVVVSRVPTLLDLYAELICSQSFHPELVILGSSAEECPAFPFISCVYSVTRLDELFWCSVYVLFSFVFA